MSWRFHRQTTPTLAPMISEELAASPHNNAFSNRQSPYRGHPHRLPHGIGSRKACGVNGIELRVQRPPIISIRPSSRGDSMLLGKR
jgi:hypothetical protein